MANLIKGLSGDAASAFTKFIFTGAYLLTGATTAKINSPMASAIVAAAHGCFKQFCAGEFGVESIGGHT
ncbi:hypothetical protein PV783_33975 [Chitinophaga sp. CC14]|uniref:hypothetical protein n=1 Tax=Chitinophaga sp. CC14 TaxID=3029199 RepID=UPI003B81BB1F